MSNAYLDIITLCSEFRTSIHKQKNSKVRRLLKPLALDKQFDEAIERFRRHRQNVVDEAETCHMIEAAEQRDAQLVLFAEERRRKLLERLSKVDCKHRHRKLKESRHEGTGAWFTSSPEFEQWMGASYSSVLCCYGIRTSTTLHSRLPDLVHSLTHRSWMRKVRSRFQCNRFVRCHWDCRLLLL